MGIFQSGITARTFSQVHKFNPYHDRLGRFTTGSGYASFSANPETNAGWRAIQREQSKNPLIGAAYGSMKSPGQLEEYRRRESKEKQAQDKRNEKKAKEIVDSYMLTSGAKGSVEEIRNFFSNADENNTIRVENGKIKVSREAYNDIDRIARRAADKIEYSSGESSEYREIHNYIKHTPLKISDYDKANIPDWNDYRKRAFGNLTTSKNGISVDSFYQELSGMYPHLFPQTQTNPADQLQTINSVVNRLKPKKMKLSGAMYDEMVKEMRNDIIRGYIRKSDSGAMSFSDVLKFNPYHDRLGKFSDGDSAASFTYKPGASTAHTKAIERERAKYATESGEDGKGFKGTLYHGSPNTDIDDFDMSRAGQNTGSGEKLIFFTDNKQMADDFSYERLEGSSKFFSQRGKKGRVYEVEVEMKKPLDFRNLSDKDIDNILKLDAEGLLTRQEVKRYAKKNHQLLKTYLDLTASKLIDLGYDGMIANTGKAGHNSYEYAIVDSKQAKIKKCHNVSKSVTFSEIAKFNPYHDRLGRFTTAGGGATFSANPNTKAGAVAIERASKDNPLIGVAYGTTKYPEKKNPNSAIRNDEEPVHISTTFRHNGGIYGGYYTQTVLSANENGDGNLVLSYAKPETTNYKKNGNRDMEYELNCGLYQRSNSSGITESVNIDWDKVKTVQGNTYESKDFLRNKGFHWDSENKIYTKEKPQARRESTESPKSTSKPKSNSSGERLVIPRGADFPSNLDGVKVISGNTYEHKEKIKAAGFKWNPADKTWVKKSFSFEELRKGIFLDDEPEPIEKKNRKRKIYIGLNLSGVDNLAIDGGESPKDFHVTLLYGFTDYPNDDEDLTVRLQNCVDKVKGSIPDKIKLDAIKRFEPSESSDGKAVIVAQVEKGQLEEVHTALVKELKNRGIHIERTFPDYKPHMTLAYIDADQDYTLSEINETADAVNISIGVGYAGEGKAPTFEIKKSDEEKRLVFGWANVAIRTNGEQIQDKQNDMVDPADLEEAVYDYVLNFRDAGEEHIQSLRKKARMVESVVFTDEKMKAMGIPAGTVPYGWWIGFYVDDDETWEKIKNGTYRMFSVEGKGIRQSIPPDEMPENIGKSAPDAKTFSQLAKFNPYHDRLGRFTTSGGGASFSANPNTVAGRKAIERASQQSPLIGVAYGTTKYPDKQKQSTGGYTSSITGSSFDMPKLENNEAEQNREKALRHVEHYFSSKTPNKEKYDETMKRYLEETDSSEWAKRANKSFFEIGHDFITAKTPKERTEEAARRKDGEARSRAMDRAAMKGTKAHKRFRDFDHEMTLKYGSKKYDKMTPEESQKWDELRNARVFRNSRGQWQIAKSFSDLMKFNPYHDRLGRFTTGGGFGVSSSMYSGDKGRQAVTFSANPDTVAGAKAIARHGGVVPRAYGMGAGGNASTNTETNQNPNRKKPAENPKNDNRTPEERRKAAIKDAEDRIRHQNYESAAVIDSNGNQILFKDGGKSQVSFTNAECQKMKGATLTHNHPSSSMFSYEDMNMFTYRELAEIRATTREGRTFVIRRDPNNSKGYAQENKFPNAYAKQFKKSLRNATDYLDKKGYREKVADGRVSQKQANKELRQHMADSLTKYCSRYAKNYGFEFFVDEGGS